MSKALSGGSTIQYQAGSFTVAANQCRYISLWGNKYPLKIIAINRFECFFIQKVRKKAKSNIICYKSGESEGLQ